MFDISPLVIILAFVVFMVVTLVISATLASDRMSKSVQRTIVGVFGSILGIGIALVALEDRSARTAIPTVVTVGIAVGIGFVLLSPLMREVARYGRSSKSESEQ